MAQPPAQNPGGPYMGAPQPPVPQQPSQHQQQQQRMPPTVGNVQYYAGPPNFGSPGSQQQQQQPIPMIAAAGPPPGAPTAGGQPPPAPTAVAALTRPPMVMQSNVMKRSAPGAAPMMISGGGSLPQMQPGGGGHMRQQHSGQQQATPQQAMQQNAAAAAAKKKRKLGDKVIPAQVRELVPESQAYMDLLAFERKLDATITRKRLDIQEALKRPLKMKRKLRIFVSHTFYPGKEVETEGEEGSIAQWELRVEGRLADEIPSPGAQPKFDVGNKQPKRKFSSFFKSLVIELDKDIYGPDNHLVEWHRTAQTNETDGFQVKRPGDRNVSCKILLLLDFQPMKFKLQPPLARLLGIHQDTKSKIVEALWQYIKTHKLQDAHERDHINCDGYLEKIFGCQRVRFMEIPTKVNTLLLPPDPIAIYHTITCEGPEQKKTAMYDIDVELDDPLKPQISQFIVSQQNQHEVMNLDAKIYETVDQIQQLKTQREFYLAFAQDPQVFIEKWLLSQCRDLKTMTENPSQPEVERRADFFDQLWTDEAVSRYFYNKVQQKRAEIEQALRLGN